MLGDGVGGGDGPNRFLRRSGSGPEFGVNGVDGVGARTRFSRGMYNGGGSFLNPQLVRLAPETKRVRSLSVEGVMERL